MIDLNKKAPFLLKPYLFVGGPAHGKWYFLDEYQAAPVVPIRTPPEALVINENTNAMDINNQQVLTKYYLSNFYCRGVTHDIYTVVDPLELINMLKKGADR